jgi:hypothetical protein
MRDPFQEDDTSVASTLLDLPHDGLDILCRHFGLTVSGRSTHKVMSKTPSAHGYRIFRLESSATQQAAFCENTRAQSFINVRALCLTDSDWLATAPNYVEFFRSLASYFPDLLLMPVTLRAQTLHMQWKEGFSFPEQGQGNVWIWAGAPSDGTMTTCIWNTTRNPLRVFFECELLVATATHFNIDISLNDTPVASLRSQGLTRISLSLLPGNNVMRWKYTGSALQENGRIVSFALNNTMLKDIQGSLLADINMVYNILPAAPSGQTPLCEIPVRNLLHTCGYLRVNGFYKTAPCEPYTLLGDSEGSPEMPGSVFLNTAERCIGKTFATNQPAWLMASAYTGKRSDTLFSRLFLGNNA